MKREDFLARVRTASAAAAPALATSYEPGPLLVDLPPADLYTEFAESLQRVDGVPHRVHDALALPAVVADIVKGYNATSYVAWDELPAAGMIDTIDALGIERLPTELSSDPEMRRDLQLGYMDLTVGITGASAGLSLSGSVVLESGPGRSRMASLIPLVHIALVDMRTMFRTLSHYAAANPDAARTTTNLNVITGPSRTGDIEMKLNLGVHGPKHMHAVVYGPDA